MIFRKRDRRGGAPRHVQAAGVHALAGAQLHEIDFDMMVKGRVIRRRGGAVRQYGVTVNGSTRLVTSGDIVDEDTYKALLAAGAIVPKAPVQDDRLAEPELPAPGPSFEPEA
ncbi:MAG TPA: hypothetical protein ENN80_08455 [Candidatus Hydrogenedentes bacterium]|nr:hypothetical protein [Candidatus Hydrogenedentota bacterium]